MKSRLLIGLATSLCFTIFLSSCYYDEVLPVNGEIPDNVSFSGDIIPIFDASCNAVGCHSTDGVSPDLTAENAYSDLFNENLITTSNPEGSELYQWMVGNRALSMPVSGSNPRYNTLVLAWIQQGALDN